MLVQTYGCASVHGRSLFHQTITTGNTDKAHLLVYDAVGPVVCEGSGEKNNKRLGSIQRDGEGKCRRPLGPVMMVMWCVGDWLCAGCCHRAGTAL